LEGWGKYPSATFAARHRGLGRICRVVEILAGRVGNFFPFSRRAEKDEAQKSPEKKLTRAREKKLKKRGLRPGK
jgi:hypothetical protein